MRFLRTKLTIALCLGFAVLHCDHPDTPPPPAPVRGEAPTPKASLKGVTGTVKVKRAAGDDWITAGDTMQLFEDDKVRTGTGASALIELANGSVITLGEDALIGIAETHARPGTDRSDVTVLKGRIDAELHDAPHQSLSVNTPAATVRAGREIVFQ